MNFIKAILSRFKTESDLDFTHWDIHALARVMAPAAWAAYDALPEINPDTGRKKYYMDNVRAEPVSTRMANIGTYDSFMMALNALMAGYKVPHQHLRSVEDLRQYLAKKDQMR